MRKNGVFLKKAICIIGTVLTVLLVALSTIICFSVKWMFDAWSNLTMDELVYHLTAPLEGTNTGMIKEYLNICVVPAILIALFILILFIAYRKQKKYFVVMGVGIILSLSISAFLVYKAWNELGAGDYVKDRGTYSTFIDENYIDPADVELSFPGQKRNLIYIFLESMETTYSDKKNGGAFEENIIPELTRLAGENEDFSGENKKLNGGIAMPGSTWTMGAMFAQTSGIPLNISISANEMDTQDAFFSNTITLGDILEQAGYTQTLLVGSDATFGGRRLYFTEHGNYEIIDYNYALESGMLPENYGVWWGYEDQKLFKFAKEKLKNLADQNTPFNLTMLTVDTHSENGYLCDICPDNFGNDQYANVLACSSRQVNEFVKWVKQQGFFDNTTIVVIGDHPTMDSDFCENIESDYVRRVYTTYINSSVEAEINSARFYTTFDDFPTTLASLGIEIEGNRLGLGANLFSGTQTLIERFGIEKVRSELNKKSKLMEDLADLDLNKEELLLREGKLLEPTANVQADAYQYEVGILPVTVSDINNLQGSVEKVMLGVWTQEDQSDLQWFQMQVGEDGNYYGNVSVPEFNYKEGEYFINAYVTNKAGEQYLIGNTTGIVN